MHNVINWFAHSCTQWMHTSHFNLIQLHLPSLHHSAMLLLTSYAKYEGNIINYYELATIPHAMHKCKTVPVHSVINWFAHLCTPWMYISHQSQLFNLIQLRLPSLATSFCHAASYLPPKTAKSTLRSPKRAVVIEMLSRSDLSLKYMCLWVFGGACECVCMLPSLFHCQVII